MSGMEDEEELEDFHLPDDLPEWSSKLEAKKDASRIRIFVDEMDDQDLVDRCKELGQKLETLTSILICPYNDSCPMIRAAAEIIKIRKDSLEELRLWFSEPVRGTKEDYNFLFQQLSSAKGLKEFDLHNPYEWEIEGNPIQEDEIVPWILASVLGALNQIETLHDVAFSSFPLTQTKETEAALLELCQAKREKPGLSLDVYDCELTSDFLGQLCGDNSRVTKLILTAIGNINDSGAELAKSLGKNKKLTALVVRRMPGSKFSSSDLSAQTASSLVTSLQNNQVLESMEISVKTDMESPGTQKFLEAIHRLEQLKGLTIQWNAKTFDHVLRATQALVDGIGKNKSLTKLSIKARINKEDGEQLVPPPDDTIVQKASEGLKGTMKAVMDQHDALKEIDVEGVLSTFKVTK